MAARLFAETHNIPALIKAPVGMILAFFFSFFSPSLFWILSLSLDTTSQHLYVVVIAPIASSLRWYMVDWRIFSDTDTSSSLCWTIQCPHLKNNNKSEPDVDIMGEPLITLGSPWIQGYANLLLWETLQQWHTLNSRPTTPCCCECL